MIIIADSGSTKTDWWLATKEGVQSKAQTIGLNPYFVTEERFGRAIISSEVATWPLDEVDSVFFYSAGITSKELQEKLAGWLEKHFKKAKIRVESDSVAAGRAAYGSDSGVFGILGTGSNSGYYDGEKVVASIPPLGYILGDEGSGNALGKRLIIEFLRNKLPEALLMDFKAYYPEHKNLLSNLYNEERPSQLLASFVPFIHQHLNNQIIFNLASNEFARFFEILKNYDNHKEVVLIGSVAYYFEDLLREIAANNNIILKKVIKSPIEALAKYHQPTS